MDGHEHEKKGVVGLARSQITKQGLVQDRSIRPTRARRSIW